MNFLERRDLYNRKKYRKPPPEAFIKNGKRKKFPYVDYNVHAGHRQRMRYRMAHFPYSMNEHEMLEVMLYPLIRRKDTNVTAHYLYDYFGGYSNVFNAELNELMQVHGVGPKVSEGLKKYQAVFELMDVRLDKGITLNSADVIAEYYETLLKDERLEGLWVTPVDNQLHECTSTRICDVGLESENYEITSIFLAARSCYTKRVILARYCPDKSCIDEAYRSDEVFKQFSRIRRCGFEIIDKVVIGRDGVYFVMRCQYVPFMKDRLPEPPVADDEYGR